jgi:hypothetical protein
VNDDSTGEPEVHTTVEPQFNTTVELQFHQEKKTLKKTLKKDEHDQFFDTIWKLYPEKKGKAKIKATKKAELYKIGFDELARCIERYKRNKPEWQNWQHGSTFFNGGYKDYQDAVYQEQEAEGGSENDGYTDYTGQF